MPYKKGIHDFKKGRNLKSEHSGVFWDAYVKSDTSDIMYLIKYNGLAVGVYLHSTPPVSHITNS